MSKHLELNKIHNIDCLEGIKKIDLSIGKYIIVTDPPYNQGYHYNKYEDNMKDDDYFDWLREITNGLPFIMIHYPESLYRLSVLTQRIPNKVISWVYNSNTKKQHRDIAFYDVDVDLSKIKQPYKNLNDKRIIERIESGSEGTDLYDWWEINQVKNVSEEKTKHPCQIPYKVMDNIIKIIPEDYIIIEPFSGSGTTAEVCKMNGRKFIAFEIDDMYYKISVDRLNGINVKGQTSIFTDFESL